VAAEGDRPGEFGVAETLPGGAREAPKKDSSFSVDQARYQIKEVLGRGGMGEVCKAYDPRLGRYVALKIMRESGPDFARRLVHEARAQARVDHPNVCKVYGVGEMNGMPFIALQYIEGSTLKELAPKMTRDELIRLLCDVADALHAAHRQGLVHRDVKPANILVERTGEGYKPYVTDFGIARQVDAPGLTKTGVAQGTPLYMAPEQARGDQAKIDRRTDVYALGVVLYEVLTKRHPFYDTTTVGVILKVLQDEVVPPRTIDSSIPQDLETITLKCLEKEPERRYENAKLLAQDLQAWLDGEPIFARAASLGYRVFKRARKHRALLVTITLLLLVGSVLGGYALHTRRIAGAQARLAQEFGQEVERNDAIGRYSALLPLHDTRRERRIIEQRMEALERNMSKIGPIAEGPGHYALGRGYLTLDRPTDARRELERAWHLDYRTPEVSYALGLAFGELYQRALTDLERTADKELLAARRVELEKKLRRPALEYLKASAPEVDAREYAEGLIALHERRWDEALAKARAAQARVPWLFEAFTLEGEVHSVQGKEQWDKGDNVGALATLERAGEAFRTASTMAPSSANALRGDCRQLALQAKIRYHSNKSPQPVIDQLEGACKKALVALPGDVETLVAESLAWGRLGLHQSAHNLDPKAALQEAIRIGEVAVAGAPRDPRALYALADAEEAFGEHLSYHSADPRPQVERVIALCEKLLAIEPRSFEVLTLIARAWIGLGDWEGAHGVDPRTSYQTAARFGGQALAQWPSGFETANTVGNAHFGSGMWELSNGFDATRSLTLAAEQFENVLKINPKVDYGYVNLCGVWETMGEYQIKHHIDPMPALLKAVSYCQEGTHADEDWSGLWLNLGCAHFDIAQWRADEGLDPTAPLDDARAELKRSLQVDTSYELGLRYQGLIDLLAARWAARSGKPPQPWFDSSRASLERAVKVEATADGHAALAEWYRRHAEWRASKKQPVADEIAEGLHEAEAALVVNPRLGSAALQAGALHLLLAKTGGPREETLERAQKSLAHALELNANLERDVKPLLDEIAHLK
jgi:serine/threonine-protein kinase